MWVFETLRVEVGEGLWAKFGIPEEWCLTPELPSWTQKKGGENGAAKLYWQAILGGWGLQ